MRSWLALAIPLLGCTKADDFYCIPPEQPYWCEAICAVRRCDDTVSEGTTQMRLCATDAVTAHTRFWQQVHAPNSTLLDCTVPKCTGPNPGYGQQGYTESAGAGSGGPFEPLPPTGDGC